MSYTIRRPGRKQSKSKPSGKRSLQKPHGVISPRVQKVGGEHFAIVCVDPAKHRSEWMMADYFGNVLIEPQAVEHQNVFIKLAVEKIRQAQQHRGEFGGSFQGWEVCPSASLIVAELHEVILSYAN